MNLVEQLIQEQIEGGQVTWLKKKAQEIGGTLEYTEKDPKRIVWSFPTKGSAQEFVRLMSDPLLASEPTMRGRRWFTALSVDEVSQDSEKPPDEPFVWQQES